MNSEWKNTFNKLIAGGCGMQLGMFLTCGVTFVMVFACLGCALAGVITLTVNDVADQVATASQPQQVAPQVISYQVIEEPPVQALEDIPLASPPPQAAPQPESDPVTELPATGAYPGPPPIVTATQGRVNLRIGPGTGYPRLGILPADASLPIVGRNPDRTWWLVTTSEGLAWVFGSAITASDLHDGIPIVDFDIPPQLVTDPNSVTVSYPAIVQTPQPSGSSSSNLVYPVGTPTAAPSQQRLYVGETVGYKMMIKTLADVPNTGNFAPRGDPILVAEGIKLHLVYGDGSMYEDLEDGNERYRVYGDGVWSPNGEYIAFVIDYKGTRAWDGTIKCKPCRAVALYQLETKAMTVLTTPDKLDAEAPRWTQDGQLLVLVHPQEPADGVAYLYNTAGQGQIATGTFLLSASKDGQKWHPWLPGRIWQAEVSERADSYYRD